MSGLGDWEGGFAAEREDSVDEFAERQHLDRVVFIDEATAKGEDGVIEGSDGAFGVAEEVAEDRP